MIAVAITGIRRIVGFAEFLQCVLPHHFQQPVTGPERAVFGDDE